MSIDEKDLEKFFQAQYANGFEEKRLFFSKANETENIIAKHYINKYIGNDSYDLVLELGPIYHIHKLKDRIKAISEAVRIAKKELRFL